MSETPPIRLQITGISKIFPPATHALDQVDLEIRAGEVHALLGENGAGKSTLSRILAGVEFPDAGQMQLDGNPYAPAGRAEAERLGVRMVMQELNLIGTLSVAENIFFHRLPSRLGFIDRRTLHERAARALAQVGLEGLDPSTRTDALSIGRQQMVEIAAGLSGRCELLILDEPTAALTAAETELLFRQIALLKTAGVAIIYISHRMAEIARVADRITVLRDGRIAGGCDATSFDVNAMIRLMIGRDVSAVALRKPEPSPEIAMRVAGLTAEPAVRDVSFTLRRGEILGFAGLMGSGRTETMRLIFGADRKARGDVYLHGSAAPARIHSPSDAVAAGIALLTENRRTQGLLLPWTIQNNVTLPSLFKVAGRLGWIRRDQEARDADALAESLNLRCASTRQRAMELSGGNQQKVVIAKWLYRDADILIFDEPTRGIDVGAKFEIYRLLLGLAERGKGIIVVSSELPELMLLCHRIAVMSAGSLVKIFPAEAFDAEAILSAALSGHVRPASNAAGIPSEAQPWAS